jgi:hypothetical protein
MQWPRFKNCKFLTEAISFTHAMAHEGAETQLRHWAANLFFREHRVWLDRVGSICGPLYLAGTAPAGTDGGVAPSSHAAQFPLHRLAFLVPGVVSPKLPIAFAHSAAYGDFVAAILALLSLLFLPRRTGVVIAWTFNICGSADILNAFYQANNAGLVPGELGAAYFLPTVIVPLLLITHGLAFRVLLQHRGGSATRESPRPA